MRSNFPNKMIDSQKQRTYRYTTPIGITVFIKASNTVEAKRKWQEMNITTADNIKR